MRKSILQFLFENGFIPETKDLDQYVFRGWNHYEIHESKAVYTKQYNYFKVYFYARAYNDHRFPIHRKRDYVYSQFGSKVLQRKSYIYNDCVYFKLRDIEIDYSKQMQTTTYSRNPLFDLADAMITYQSITTLSNLHKKYCPTKRTGSWKKMSIAQLTKLLNQFEKYDSEIGKAIKIRQSMQKVKQMSVDFE